MVSNETLNFQMESTAFNGRHSQKRGAAMAAACLKQPNDGPAIILFTRIMLRRN